MKTVRDDDGTRYLLLKRSTSASLVRDPKTGNECYIRNDRLEAAEDESALETAARAVGEPVRTLLSNVHDERTLGLLVELDERGPLPVRTLMTAYDFCESDLHGRLAVLSAADLLKEVDVAGGRGYGLTETALEALEVVRTSGSADRDPGDGDADADAEPTDADADAETESESASDVDVESDDGAAEPADETEKGGSTRGENPGGEQGETT